MTEKFKKNDPVTHRDGYGIQHDYFVKYAEDGKHALVSDGRDGYQTVRLNKLKKGHL